MKKVHVLALKILLWRCAVSTSAVTRSGGANREMPCPQLAVGDGAGIPGTINVANSLRFVGDLVVRGQEANGIDLALPREFVAGAPSWARTERSPKRCRRTTSRSAIPCYLPVRKGPH